MNTIHVHYNGELRTLPQDATLQHALALFAAATLYNKSPIASALNGCHVPRTDRDHTRLAEGDHITTFEPITGG